MLSESQLVFVAGRDFLFALGVARFPRSSLSIQETNPLQNMSPEIVGS
jgi:hypothetical protein